METQTWPVVSTMEVSGYMMSTESFVQVFKETLGGLSRVEFVTQEEGLPKPFWEYCQSGEHSHAILHDRPSYTTICQKFLANPSNLRHTTNSSDSGSQPEPETSLYSELDAYLGSVLTMPLPFKLATSLPFNHYYQLYPKLIISPDGAKIFRQEPSEKDTLPGEPRIKLADPRIGTFLLSELSTPDLNKFFPYLWQAGRQSSTDITPLSEQAVHGRDIIVTSNPELHLIWNHDRIYIKPIPKYLFSSSFWQYYIIYETSPLHDTEQEQLRESATGFLRSYAHLIRHRCDFNLAQQKGLIPKYIRYTEFIQFITSFESQPDSEVSKRYCFGELRLSRLNMWSLLALRRLTFHDDVRGSGAILTQFYGPLFFIFGIVAIVLASMQVQLLAKPTKGGGKGLFEFFSGLMIFIGGMIVLGLFISALITGGRECFDAIRDLKRRKREKGAANVEGEKAV